MATLYRKYRPQTFQEIIGQEHVVRTLQKALELERVAHAYLFSGARGVGKTTLARILAKAVNCLEAKHRPCGKCRNCLDIADGRFVDLIEIDAASNRGIDEMRDLRDRVGFAPSVGRMRVYIIDEVHMLTREAFNALLKTLEEPPAHTLFIFATTEVHRVPATILSRCQRFDFRLGTDEAIAKNLEEMAKKEKLKLTKEVADLIVRCAGGSYRDAQSILDQLSSHLVKKKLEIKEAVKLLNLSSVEQVDKFIQILEKSDLEGAISYLRDLGTRNVSFADFTDAVIVELRRRMIAGILQGSDVAWLKETLETVARAKKTAQNTPVESLALELAAVEICATQPSAKPSDTARTPDKQSAPPPANPKTGKPPKITHLPDEKRRAIQEAINQKNMALGALLAPAGWEIACGKVCFVVAYPIYQEKLMSQSALALIESCIAEVTGEKIQVTCRVERPEDVGEEIEAVFGGGI